MKNKERLLINTLADLQSRLDEGDEYNLIRAAGLIRQLLLDRAPLMDVVNMNYKLIIKFKTQKGKIDFQDKLVIDGVEVETVIGVSFIEAKHGDEQYTSYLTRDEFLKYKVIYFAGQDFTVFDIIKLCAHIYGGVHHDNIKKAKDLYLDWANKTVTYKNGVNCAVNSIKDIISITIDALQPLVDEIKKEQHV